VVLLFVAFAALSAAFGAVDFALLAGAVRGGIWWLIAIGFPAARVARVGSAVSTVGASHRPVPLGPVYVLQLAMAYIALVIPESAARFAVNVRFLQKQGLPLGSALAVSGLDSVWWFVVQIGAVSGILIATPLSLDLDLGDSTSGGLGRLVTIVVGLALLSVVILFAVPQWRRPALARALLDRSATFYLPPLWGFFAVRWMERRQLLRPVRRRSPL